MSCHCNQVCGDQRGQYIALKRAKAFPGTLVKPETALEPGDPCLDILGKAGQTGL